MGFNPEPLFTPEFIPACTQHLGGELIDYDSNDFWVKIKFSPRPEFVNPIGHVQGGFVTAMLDECFSLAAFLPFNGDMICPTVENKTQYLRPAPMETLIGEGRVLKSGKSIVFSEATLSTEAGILIAKASATSIPKPVFLAKAVIMYPPAYYTNNDPGFMRRIIQEHSFAVMSTAMGGDIRATHLPFILKTKEGRLGTLYGHIAANNPQVEDLKNNAPALVIFSGRMHISRPAGMRAPQNRVPTWNYISVQAKGTLSILPKTEWLAEMENLTQAYEPDGAWTITKAQDYVDRLMRGIVYFKMEIESLQGIEKMSQNKSHSENQTVISELKKREEFETAEAMAHAIKDKMK